MSIFRESEEKKIKFSLKSDNNTKTEKLCNAFLTICLVKLCV